MKKYFNKGLYTETLRQTTLPAVLFFFLYLLINILNILEPPNITPQYAVSQVGYMPFLLPLICTLILTVTAFNYLTKRKLCDFYGALPYSPGTRFVSPLCAVLTHLLFTLLFATVILCVIALFFGYGYRIYLSELICILTNLLSACFLTSTVTLFSLILLNKKPSAMILSYLIIFSVVSIISGIRIYYFAAYPGTKFTPHLDVFKGLEIFCISIKYAPLMIVSGIIFFILAYFLFSKKGYELETSNAGQVFFNVLCSLALPLLICTYSYNAINTLFSELFPYISFFAIIVAFFAEVISSKSFKHIHRAFVGFGIMFLTLTLIVGNLGVTKLIAQKKAKKLEVTAVALKATKSMTPNRIAFEKNTFYSYEQLNVQEVFLNDPEILDIVNDLLDRGSYRSTLESINRAHLNVVVKFNNGKTADISLSITSLSRTRLIELFFENPKVQKAYLKIKKPGFRLFYTVEGITDIDKQRQLHKCFYEEYQTLNVQQKQEVSLFSYAYAGYTLSPNFKPANYVILNVFEGYGKNAFSSVYRFNEGVMPKTYELYQQLRYSN